MPFWEIDNSMLVLHLDDENTIVPSAKEIYGIVYKGNNTIRDIPIPSGMPDIEFSKYPIDLSLLLRAHYIEGTFEIFLHVVTCIGKYSYKIDFNLDTQDHTVIDNTWYPFTPGDIDFIKQVFEESSIKTIGRISLKQYLSLISFLGRNPKLNDEVPNGIKNNINIPDYDTPIPLFNGNLYPYQTTGFNWLKMIASEDSGCILGDEMGLGKTIQIIALLSLEKANARKTSLVIVPPSLTENWRREIIKFAPSINYLVHKGHNRTGFHSVLRKYDIIITTYDIVVKDLPMFKMIEWNLIIVDEAHFIKNPYAKRTIALKELEKRVAIAVTGTPLQNRLLDLWSVTDFILPNYLGSLNSFESKYSDNVDNAENLELLVSPILLRRLVSEVATDLPVRIDVPQAIEMLDVEANVYEDIRCKIIEEYGPKANLVSITKLRLYCAHPFLISCNSGDPTEFSTKYQRLVEILEEIVDLGEKVLIFASFSKMVDLLVSDITQRFCIYCSYIDGRVDTGERQDLIDNFEEIIGSAVLVLNPRAAGVGLNITAANHVIHYTLEWNPAVEDQATARAYRRGQTRPVTVHRLYYADTVEDVMNLRIEMKRTLFDSAIVGHDGTDDNIEDIIRAINMSPVKGYEKNE